MLVRLLYVIFYFPFDRAIGRKVIGRHDIKNIINFFVLFGKMPYLCIYNN